MVLLEISRQAAKRLPPDGFFTTHDGVIVPLPRCKLADAGTIRRLMAQDIIVLVAECGGDEALVTEDDLLLKGWTIPQVQAHGWRARQMAYARLAEADAIASTIETEAEKAADLARRLAGTARFQPA